MSKPVLLDAQRLRTRIVDQGPFAELDVVPVTGSTNTDLIAAAERGATDRTVLIAEEQQTGRGRMQRPWLSPRGYGLHLSVLLRPTEIPRSAIAWLPLIAGVALAETVRNTTTVNAALKWPNDLLIGEGDSWRKAAGILADGVTTTHGLAVVLGIGVNVHHGPHELPTGNSGLPATSLTQAGAAVDRQQFTEDLLIALNEADTLWRKHAGDVVGSGLLDRYQRLCGTIGRQVRVEMSGESDLSGTATEIDPVGRLVVRGTDGAVTPVSAGDIVHLRPA